MLTERFACNGHRFFVRVTLSFHLVFVRDRLRRLFVAKQTAHAERTAFSLVYGLGTVLLNGATRFYDDWKEIGAAH